MRTLSRLNERKIGAVSGELIFKDRAGVPYQPVRHYNRTTGRSAFRVKPTGATNRAEEALEFDTIEEVARAMLVDGLPARVQPVGGGTVNYLRFGAEKLISYELDERIAERLGIAAKVNARAGGHGTALVHLRARFLRIYPDFEQVGYFSATAGSYHETFRIRVDALLAAVARNKSEAAAILTDVLVASRQQSRGAPHPFFDGDVVWRTPRARDVDPALFDAAVLDLMAGSEDLPIATERFNAKFWPLLQASANGKPYRDTRVLPSTLLALVAPDQAISIRYQSYSNASKLLNDRFLFADKPMAAKEYRDVLALAGQIRSAMMEWGWRPRDLWDVHGFVLATCGDRDLDRNAADDILAHFDVNEGFRQTRQQWTEDQTTSFVALAQAIHETGLDWYFVNIAPYQLRYGNKPRGRDAREVVGVVYGSPPLMFLRGLAPPAIKPDGKDTLPVNNALGPWVAEHHELLSSRSSAERDVGLWPDDFDLERSIEPSNIDLQDKVDVTTNLILYGPPGTGKTYHTAQEAVRLCGEEPSADRQELMTSYRKLAEAGRIEFVTFHQSMAYEEFVEGLRPSSTDEDGLPLSGGFRLVPTPGIFRRIARRAETSTGPGDGAFAVGDRKVFKMSLGNTMNPDDAHLFDEAILNQHIVLGFEDIDWSDKRYGDRDEILAACQAVAPLGTKLNSHSAVVQMPHIFRNMMREGDMIIVSKGTKLFRAIGVITGGYRFAPREGGDYGHQRDVHWLWVDRDGVQIEEIYTRGFSMRTTYEMFSRDLNVPALERYANSQRKGSGSPEPFVLVIDEINRANISKVFGELITLLETDKRLGRTNELRVRLPYSSDLFGVPANLHIVGTMNTADRSIALIDKALRRRFTFREMMPDYSVEGMEYEIVGADVTLAEVLRTLNSRIEYLLDREHQIGHGWVLGCTTKADLDEVMRDKVIPLIAEYFFEDWGRTVEVLGGRTNNPFLEAVALAPPPGIDGDEPRYRWLLRQEFAPDAYVRLVGRI